MANMTFAGAPYVGEIRLFAGNSAPRGWRLCDGALLSLQDYPVLFQTIGTTYGGDGIMNFALPDLRGRVPIGKGQGQGLSVRNLGQQIGVEAVTLTVANLPAHSHMVQASNASANQSNPVGNTMAQNAAVNQFVNTAATGNMSSPTGNTGSGNGLSVIQPSLGLNFIICLEGLDPRGDDVRIIPGP